MKKSQKVPMLSKVGDPAATDVGLTKSSGEDVLT